jgi:type IV pilus assembly protein PilM
MFFLDRWLGRRQDPVLGIDIGAGGIHLVELGSSCWPFRIRHAGYAPLPQGALRDGSIVMQEAVADALRHAVKASGTRLRDAALALSARSVMKKVVSLPEPLHEDDLEAEVDAEAGANLPFERADIGIDFAVLGPSAGESGFVDVMLVDVRVPDTLGIDDDARPLVAPVEAAGLVDADPALAVQPHLLDARLGVLLHLRRGVAAAARCSVLADVQAEEHVMPVVAHERGEAALSTGKRKV